MCRTNFVACDNVVEIFYIKIFISIKNYIHPIHSVFCNVFSSGMKIGLSRKDELFNELICDCQQRGVAFDDSVADSDGRYIIQVRSCLKFHERRHCPSADDLVRSHLGVTSSQSRNNMELCGLDCTFNVHLPFGESALSFCDIC